MEFVLAAFLILVCVWALWWASRKSKALLEPTVHSDRLAHLEQQVAQLTRRVWQLEHDQPSVTAPVSSAPDPVLFHEMVTPLQWTATPQTEPIADPEATPAFEIPAAAPLVEPTTSWEASLGENWLLKIGALVLVIGLALLPTYSFGLLGPLGRTLMAIFLSAAFLTGGIVVEGRWAEFRRWAWGLIGVGWAGLYFTGFAAHSIETTRVIESPVIALFVLLGVALLMVLHSLRYRDERVTGFTLFLAYVSFLLYRDQPIVLPAMGLLAVGALFVSWIQGWRWLVLGDLVLTYSAHAYLPGHAGVILGFGDPILWLLWVAFEAYDCLALRRARGVPFGLHLNAIGFVAASILAERQPDWHYGWYLTWATAAFALSSLLRWWILRGRPEDDSLQDELIGSGPTASLVLMSLALTGAIFNRFDGLAETFALLLEGEFLFLAGLRSPQRVLRWMGTGVLVLFAVKLVLIDASASYGTRVGWADLKAWVPLAAAGFAVFLGNRILLGGANAVGFAFGIAASAFWSWMVDAIVPREWRAVVFGTAGLAAAQYAPKDFTFQALASAYAALVYFAIFTLSSSIAIPAGLLLAGIHWWIAQLGTWRVAGLTATAGLLSILIWDQAPDPWRVPGQLALASLLLAAPLLQMRSQGLGLLWLTAARFVIVDLERARLLWGTIPARVAAGLPLILLHGAIGNQESAYPRIARLSQLGATMLSALLIGAQFEREWSSIGWGVAGAGMLGLGFLREQRWLRLGGLGLFGLGVLKLFLYDLNSLSGLARILSFIVLGLQLMAASWAYTKFKR